MTDLTPEQKKRYVSRRFSVLSSIGLSTLALAGGLLAGASQSDPDLAKIGLEIANRDYLTIKIRPTFRNKETCIINSRLITAGQPRFPVISSDAIDACTDALEKTGVYKPAMVIVPASFAIKHSQP